MIMKLFQSEFISFKKYENLVKKHWCIISTTLNMEIQKKLKHIDHTESSDHFTKP